MKTSYFANIQNLRNPVSICQGPPWWWTGPEYRMLAPPWELVHAANNGMSEHEYKLEYSGKILSRLNPKEVYDHLVENHGEDCVLLCYEDLARKGDWCHRRMVAHWLEDALGIEVPEWQPSPRHRSTLSW